MAKKKTAKKKSAQAIPFEDSLEQLRAIVTELEGGQLSLDASLEKYEAGIKHLKDCYAALKKAEQRIEMLVDVDANGNLLTQSIVGSHADEADFEREAREDLADETGQDMDDPERLF